MKELFFEQQLRGENALTRLTAAKLCELAMRVGKAAPWCDLDETDLILIRDDQGQVHAVSVMGALGEFRAVVVYVGAEGYRFFQQVHDSDEDQDMDLFIGRQHAVRVEFGERRDLEAEDRVLLKEVGPALIPRGRHRVPLFRAVRPGYLEWFVTQEEGRLLELGIEALLHLIDAKAIVRGQGPPYPLVEWKDGELKVEIAERPNVPPEPLRTAPINRLRVDDFKFGFRLSKEPVIVDHFYLPMRIGQKDDRKMAMRMTVAMDGATGMALAPNASAPTDRTEDLLARATLDAIQQLKRIPATLVVRKQEYAEILRPLAAEFGMTLMVIKRIPPLEDLKAMMRVHFK